MGFRRIGWIHEVAAKACAEHGPVEFAPRLPRAKICCGIDPRRFAASLAHLHAPPLRPYAAQGHALPMGDQYDRGKRIR